MSFFCLVSETRELECRKSQPKLLRVSMFCRRTVGYTRAMEWNIRMDESSAFSQRLVPSSRLAEALDRIPSDGDRNADTQIGWEELETELGISGLPEQERKTNESSIRRLRAREWSPGQVAAIFLHLSIPGCHRAESLD